MTGVYPVIVCLQVSNKVGENQNLKTGIYKFLVLTGDGFLGSFRTRKAVLALVLYFGMFFLVAYGFIRVQEAVSTKLAQEGIDGAARTALLGAMKDILRRSGDEAAGDFLLSVPFLNVSLFVVTILGTPLLVLLVKYDLLARDISDGTLRYLTFRVSRAQIIVSRLAASLLEFAVITLAALLIALLWARARIPSFPLKDGLLAGGGFWLKSQLFLSVFVCLVLFASVLVRRPFVALLLSCAMVLFFLLLPLWTDYASPFDFAYLRGLFYRPSPPLYLSLGAYLAFSAVFFAAAAAVFSRRNL